MGHKETKSKWARTLRDKPEPQKLKMMKFWLTDVQKLILADFGDFSILRHKISIPVASELRVAISGATDLHENAFIDTVFRWLHISET